VGAVFEDAGGDFAGAAYVFQVLSSTVDTDLDGCVDKREAGANPNQGGGRDPFNHWDFFDAPTPPGFTRDKAITIGDIGAVVARFGAVRPGGAPDKATALGEDLSPVPSPPAYHAGYDRTASTGMGQPWRTNVPNGSITIQDISLAVQSFGHSCV